MRINRRNRTRLEPESLRLPLIALIDVVLFLLLYFVISFSISAEERELAAALAAPGPSESLLQPQVVRVDWLNDSATFRVGEQSFSDRAQLTDLLRKLPKPPGVTIKPSPDAPIEATAAAVQASRDAGFTNISYATGTK